MITDPFTYVHFRLAIINLCICFLHSLGYCLLILPLFSFYINSCICPVVPQFEYHLSLSSFCPLDLSPPYSCHSPRLRIDSDSLYPRLYLRVVFTLLVSSSDTSGLALYAFPISGRLPDILRDPSGPSDALSLVL